MRIECRNTVTEDEFEKVGYLCQHWGELREAGMLDPDDVVVFWIPRSPSPEGIPTMRSIQISKDKSGTFVVTGLDSVVDSDWPYDTLKAAILAFDHDPD